MIPAHVSSCVFAIRWNGKTGTGFTIVKDGREYLITARHGVESWTEPGKMDLLSHNRWCEEDAALVGHCPGGCDISVFAFPRKLTLYGTLPAQLEGVFYGQEVYFLGFPYNLAHLGAAIVGPEGRPFPFVKRGTLSLFGLAHRIYIDGHNNPGFSGGPVVYQDMKDRVFKVAAVIAGFRYENHPVYESGTETPLTFKYNTGIIESFSIEAALQVIRSNPIGFPVPSTSPQS